MQTKKNGFNIKNVIETAGLSEVIDIDKISDGFHTFSDLYYQRCVLFAVIFIIQVIKWR